jgi:hypothetical protein
MPQVGDLAQSPAIKRVETIGKTQTDGSSVIGLGEVGVGVSVGVGVIGSSAVGLGGVGVDVGVGVGVGAVGVGVGIWFKMRPRSARFHAFTCSSIVDMSAPIRNAKSVFLFFAATLVLRISSLASCFGINADHLASDFSSLMAE